MGFSTKRVIKIVYTMRMAMCVMNLRAIGVVVIPKASMKLVASGPVFACNM